MSTPRTRREFLAEVSRGMLAATVGYAAASDLGLASAPAEETELTFGPLEPLVRMMQETPANRLLPALVEQLRAGADLRRLTAAAALANARVFGGEDYVGFHTMMALGPALRMSGELPTPLQPLPVFKVLYRNTNRIGEHGGGPASETLRTVTAATLPAGRAGGDVLRDAVRRQKVNDAEQTLAALAQRSPEEAFNELLWTVQDSTEVHRVVLPYRAWDLLGLIGRDQALTLLRQSVRYCVKAESWSHRSDWDSPRALLPKMFDEHKLMGRAPGNRVAEDGWVDQMSQAIFRSTPEQAAGAAATALAEGISPDALGEAITLAANQLVLRDMGRRPQEEVAGKPVGSVHGDSIGVHATDSANAWRNMARAGNPRNCFACLILGAYQVALDRVGRGGDFLHWDPLPTVRHLGEIKTADPAALLREADEAIRGNLQAKAVAVIQRYGELGHAPRPAFDLLIRYAVSEDGALHGEKFYRTVSEEFASTRPVFRWRHMAALARVTASEFGRPAAGVAEARDLLKV